MIYDPSTALHVDETVIRIVDASGQPISEPLCATTEVALADLDNDGDVDAVVHLFELQKVDNDKKTYVVQSPNFTRPDTSYSCGWHCLEIIANPLGSAPLWFQNFAAARMISLIRRSMASGTAAPATTSSVVSTATVRLTSSRRPELRSPR